MFGRGGGDRSGGRRSRNRERRFLDREQEWSCVF